MRKRTVLNFMSFMIPFFLLHSASSMENTGSFYEEGGIKYPNEKPKLKLVLEGNTSVDALHKKFEEEGFYRDPSLRLMPDNTVFIKLDENSNFLSGLFIKYQKQGSTIPKLELINLNTNAVVFIKNKWELPMPLIFDQGLKTSTNTLSLEYVDCILHKNIGSSIEYIPDNFDCFLVFYEQIHPAVRIVKLFDQIKEKGLDSAVTRLLVQQYKEEYSLLYLAYDTEAERNRGEDLLSFLNPLPAHDLSTRLSQSCCTIF